MRRCASNHLDVNQSLPDKPSEMRIQEIFIRELQSVGRSVGRSVALKVQQNELHFRAAPNG